MTPGRLTKNKRSVFFKGAAFSRPFLCSPEYFLTAKKFFKKVKFSVDISCRSWYSIYCSERTKRKTPRTLGGIAQLGERLTGSQEVSGSIPLISTKACNRKGYRLFFFAKKWTKREKHRVIAHSLPTISGLDDAVIVGGQFLFGAWAIPTNQNRRTIFTDGPAVSL